MKYGDRCIFLKCRGMYLKLDGIDMETGTFFKCRGSGFEVRWRPVHLIINAPVLYNQ